MKTKERLINSYGKTSIKAYDVVCLGGVIADIVTCAIDRLPGQGKLALINTVQLHPGGCAGNSALALAKIGLRAAVIGKVGADPFGRYLTAQLESAGVNMSGLKIHSKSTTSTSVVLIGSHGERRFLFAPGVLDTFEEKDADFAIIRKACILFIAGALLFPRFDGKPMARILCRARERGVFTALDVVWDATGRWRENLDPCLPYLDLVMPSKDEAAALTGQSKVPDMAAELIGRGARLVVIKMGARDCYIKKRSGETHVIPSYRVPVVDTTGAGDSFAAGFLAGIVQGWDLDRCGRFANAVGAHCVMALGATAGVKPMRDIIAFMNSSSQKRGV